jgi:phosphoribosylformylglycinamidine cyclo-ligase
VDDQELARATNLGVGIVVVLPAREVDAALAVLEARGLPAWVIGGVTSARPREPLGSGLLAARCLP